METDRLYPAALELLILSGLIVKTARRSVEDGLQAHGVPLSMLAYGVLRLLEHQEQTLSELSRRMSLRPATLVPVIDALEREGLARRLRDVHDRRRIRLCVTEQGRATLAALPPLGYNDALQQGLGALGDEQTQRLLSLLRCLVQQLPGGEEMLSLAQARVHAHLAAAPHSREA